MKPEEKYKKVNGVAFRYGKKLGRIFVDTDKNMYLPNNSQLKYFCNHVNDRNEQCPAYIERSRRGAYYDKLSQKDDRKKKKTGVLGQRQRVLYSTFFLVGKHNGHDRVTDESILTSAKYHRDKQRREEKKKAKDKAKEKANKKE